MERIKTMCRICLVENVRMNEVNNRHLQEVYEKLTDIPFVTEDNRPMLACFFCYTKLKQCWQLQRKCLKAEELFAKLLNEGYKFNLKNQNQLEFLGGFTETKLENISIGIGDVCEGQSAAIKEELSDVCETQDDIEIKVEHLSDVSELENVEYNHPDVEDNDKAKQHSGSEDDEPLIKTEIKQEGVQEVPKKNQIDNETNSTSAAKKPKLKPNAITKNALLSKPKKNVQDHSEVTKKKATAIETEAHIYIDVDTKNIEKPKSEEITVMYPSSSDRKYSSVPDNLNKLGHCDTGGKDTPYDKSDPLQKSSSTSAAHLKTHISKQTGQKPYKCDTCQNSYSKPSHLKLHIRTHTNEKPFVCGICQKRFKEKNGLKRHIRAHTKEKPFKCHICHRSFNQAHSLKYHINTHTNEKSFKCDTCQKSFSASRSLKKHSRIHSNEKPYECDICQKSFNVPSDLKLHFIRTHTTEKSFTCSICQKGFKTKGSLTRHIRTHTNEKPFKCHICQKSFNQTHSLKYHINTHTKEKTFKCDICQRSFSALSLLIPHIRRHTNDNPHKCNICKKTFSSPSHLTRHIRTHTNEKPFKCDICQKRFNFSCNLKTHILTHTK